MRLQRLVLLACWLAAAGPAECDGAQPGSVPVAHYRNLFAELLGKSDAEVDAKISGAWRQFFQGDGGTERLYYPVAGEMAYVPDINNRDVRTEGLSYGMMICVQLDRQAEFNRIWKWARTNLYHPTGPMRGFFARHGDYEGRQLDPGPAPDGEEWFAKSLFFAAHRWGSGKGIFDYEGEAQGLLRAMLHKGDDPERGGSTDMFDREVGQVVFEPHGDGAKFTDPSYHLPAFYELWSRWAAAPGDRAFMSAAAKSSRALFRLAANPGTGLMPDYCEFDGRPRARNGHEDFRYDAWRTLSNPALDFAWFAADPWEAEQSNRVLRFFSGAGQAGHDRFKLDGTPIGSDLNSPGLVAMAATAGLAADGNLSRPFVDALWRMGVPSGQFRYYNGLLYMLGLLETGGRFRVYPPPGQ